VLLARESLKPMPLPNQDSTPSYSPTLATNYETKSLAPFAVSEPTKLRPEVRTVHVNVADYVLKNVVVSSRERIFVSETYESGTLHRNLVPVFLYPVSRLHPAASSRSVIIAIIRLSP
jgi:hypothetical protein